VGWDWPIMHIDKFLRPWCVGTGLAPVRVGPSRASTRTGARPVPTHQGQFILFISVIGAEHGKPAPTEISYHCKFVIAPLNVYCNSFMNIHLRYFASARETIEKNTETKQSPVAFRYVETSFGQSSRMRGSTGVVYDHISSGRPIYDIVLI
jgi:hypothetical protein